MVPGMQLVDALERLADWASGITRASEEREEELIAERNNRALARIEAMMGVPVSKRLSREFGA